jgi:O-antigen ligase
MIIAQRWLTYTLLAFGAVCVPLSVYLPGSPNVTFAALGLLSLLMLITRRDLDEMVEPLNTISVFLLFLAWALVACYWSLTPVKSLIEILKISIAIAGAVAFYAVLTDSLYEKFMQVFTIGFVLALGFLTFDEILSLYVLKLFLGPNVEGHHYAHGITIVALGMWPLLNIFKNQNIALRILLIQAILLGILFMSDHAATLALLIGLATWLISYISPKIVMRVAAILSAIIILALPFALKEMDPVEVIEKTKSYLIKPSYRHRLFILKRTTNMIFEEPWIGHGINTFRSTIDPEKVKIVGIELTQVMEKGHAHPVDLQALGQSTHPHNLSLQIWYELGAIGAVLYALFVSLSLWRLSKLPNRRSELATFMGLYATMFTIAHISFGAWQTWWLFSAGIILSLTLWQTLRAREI